MANSAVEEALKDAGLDPLNNCPIDSYRFGVHIASIFGVYENENSMVSHFDGRKDCIKSLAILVPALIALRYKLRGQLDASQAACSAGLFQIGNSFRMIRDGYLDAAITGGADVTVNSHGQLWMENLQGINLTHNHDPEGSIKPYDKDRAGTVCGDGAGIFILESLESALKRGARIYAEVTGYSAHCEAYHIFSPSPQDFGLVRSLMESTQEAGLTNESIDVITSHATATRVGDVCEAAALKYYLGTSWDKLLRDKIENVIAQKESDLSMRNVKKTLITCQKANIGHSLIPSGAIEALISV